ncbi:MAG TPA: LysM peptidoglycan-binding domain-containing protein, partial [Anaeromyxobacteraceae bacterium]|nr:LysM peptidoglycan-binding domain-containing protein [Anaeromyxobacteraceae bacterium]
PEASERAGKLAFAQHRVGRGESLKAIAASYRVDVASIVRMNGLKPGRHVKPGTEIVVPLNALARSQGVTFASTERALAAAEKPTRTRRAAGRQPAAPSAEPAQLASLAGRLRATVRVQNGDTLWSIAQRFGVAVHEIARWNGIRDARRFKLQVGREIVVYPRRNASAEPSPDARGG